MPVEAGFSLTTTLIALQLPGCPGRVRALLVGILPLVPFPTAPLLPGSYHCDLAAAATPTVGPCTCFTPRETIHQNSLFVGSGLVKSHLLLPHHLHTDLSYIREEQHKSESSQKTLWTGGGLVERPSLPSLSPCHIPEPGFAPAWGSSALSCNTLKDSLYGTMVGPLASVQCGASGIQKPLPFLLGKEF